MIRMEFTRNFSSISKNDALIAGGKGASLGEMTQAGISVPSGFVLLSKAFDKFLEATDLDVEIDSILHSVNNKEMHTVENASEKIQELILELEMPKDIENEIIKEFKKLGTKFVAVRSSATAEDGAEHAWAGQLESYLNTTSENLVKNVQKCWASLFTPRAIFYRFEKNLHKDKISVAVVVQMMVESEKSGIAFSVHPVTQDKNQLIIEAGFGLGEAIVSGQITPDSYVVEKNPRRIIDKNISEKTRTLERKKGGGNEWIPVPVKKQKTPVLSDKEIFKLSELILKIENHYGFPCDIEWAFENNNFYIVQSRPITTLTSSSSEEKTKQPTTKDFIFTFEAQGVTPLFQEIVCKSYLPQEVVFLCPKESVRSFVSKETINKMHEVGAEFFSNYNKVLSTLTKLEHLIEQTNIVMNVYGKQEKISSDDATNAFQLMEKIHEEYGKFDFAYTDGAYEKAGEVTPTLALVEEYKNRIREKYGELFFAEKGGLIKFLSVIANEFDLSMNDLRWCLESEIFEILAGQKMPVDDIVKRKKAYVFYKDQFKKINFFEGKKAEIFIENFEDKIPSSVVSITGSCAHSTGIPVLGKIAVINSDYLDFSKVQKRMAKMKNGEILVSATTAPDLMDAFRKASAVVTDVGGMLSHAAITARELNIPCIVGTSYATKLLKDGDFVEVDAEKGVVRILERNKKFKPVTK